MTAAEEKEYRAALQIAARCRAKGLRAPEWYRNTAARFERVYPEQTQKILSELGIK